MSTSASERKGAGAPRHHSAKSSGTGRTGKELTPSEHRVQVAAARLRVTLDERLGRQTPPETKKLAQEDY